MENNNDQQKIFFGWATKDLIIDNIYLLSINLLEYIYIHVCVCTSVNN